MQNPTTPVSLITRDTSKLTGPNQNVYESIYIMGKRARQIALKHKEDINNKLSEFSVGVDNLEEIHENREQIEVSKQYERMPKATAIAMEEFLAGELHYHTLTPEEEQAATEAAAARASERPARRN